MKTLELVSIEDYLKQEETAFQRSEYHDGDIVAMAGAKPAHVLAVTNLIMLLGFCLKKKKCKVYSNDRLLYIRDCYKFVYPDVIIVCEDEKNLTKDGLEPLENPSVIIEVLSESTEKYDRNEKFECYQTIESLQQIVLVDYRQVLVETYTKNEKNEWVFVMKRDKSKTVKIGDCELLLEDIYDKIIVEAMEEIVKV